MKRMARVGIPPFIASASFDMDLQAVGPKLLGCVAVLMEQDDTRQSDIVFGRIAYSKEMEKQLNALMVKRIQTNNSGPLTEAEKETIRAAVKSRVTTAVGSHQGGFDIFRDQDDNLGFTHIIFPGQPGETIQATTFDFPEIVTTRVLGPISAVSDRYVLSGAVTVAAVPRDTVDLCARQRAALEAKRQEIKSLQNRRTLLQQQLQTATPQQKSGIVQAITATNAEIDKAEAQLPALETALKTCTDGFGHDHIDVNDVGGLSPG